VVISFICAYHQSWGEQNLCLTLRPADESKDGRR